MAEGTTLLSYEMGWQLRLFDLMTASQQSNDYVMACTYGIALLEILGLENMPKKKMPEKGGGGHELATWQNYFTEILMAGIGQIRTTIDIVRKNYKKDGQIPTYTKPQEARN